MNSAINQWAIRNGVSFRALEDLRSIFRLIPERVTLPDGEQKGEAFVQSLVRIEAGRKGLRLWRNNVGALLDDRGVPVRYGLANDSKRLNEVVKSGDLIGWRPLLISPLHVGHTLAQFVSRECKAQGWTYTGTEHEQAQLKWAQLVAADGGDAAFCTGEGTL
jgi:hypothetical protein